MADIQSQRWCIYIDMLGFSQLWESDEWRACNSLRELMRAIYRIGVRVYPNGVDRLFVHQMGDGFAIVSNFGEPSLERPIAIATALMRCVASTGTFAAAAIAEGEFADIQGCYPDEVLNGSDGAGSVRLGAGLMTLSSVMGTAFIRAFRLNNDAPSGPLLTVSECHHGKIPADLPVRKTKGKKCEQLLAIDWIRSETSAVTYIQQKAGLITPTSEELVQAINDYCLQYEHPCKKWSTMRDLLQLPGSS